MASQDQNNAIQTLVTSLLNTVFTPKMNQLATAARSKIKLIRQSEDKLKQEVSSLNRQITDLGLKINNLDSQKKLLEEQNINTQAQLDSQIHSMNSNAAANCGDIAKQKFLLQSKIRIYKSQVDSLKKSKLIIDKKIKNLNTELTKNKEAKTELDSIIKQIKTEKQQQQQTNSVLTQDLSAKKTMINKLNSDISKLEMNNTDLKSKKTELETKNTQLNTEITKLKTELTEKNTTIKQMELSTSTDKSEIDKLIAKNVDLEYLIKTNETLISSIRTCSNHL